MQITDWPEQNLLGLLYLIVLLLCCFGSGPKWVWAPVEALSAISLVSQYLVGVKAIQGWLFPAGCCGPIPAGLQCDLGRSLRIQRRSVMVRSYYAILRNAHNYSDAVSTTLTLPGGTTGRARGLCRTRSTKPKPFVRAQAARSLG